jgi:hypothetical protein
MKFAVQLKGQADTLENVSSCFQGDSVKVVKRDDDWFLESLAFEACANGGQVFPIADDILFLIHRVCYLYAGLLAPFEIGYVQPFDEEGLPLRRALRASRKINVYSSSGVEELRTLRGVQTEGTQAVGCALADDQIRAGLSLIGDGEPEWPQLYNVVEFMGFKTIVKKKWASEKQVRRFRQTANHYRHTSRPTKNPLPPDPPSLSESRAFVRGLFKTWMSNRIQSGQVAGS